MATMPVKALKVSPSLVEKTFTPPGLILIWWDGIVGVLFRGGLVQNHLFQLGELEFVALKDCECIGHDG